MHPDDTACPHGYLYPSVGGQTPCHVPNCGDESTPSPASARNDERNPRDQRR